jgi:uncharacterized protein
MMDSLLLSALITGLIGSLHCLGMCGPIALMLPQGSRSPVTFLFNRILYNLGRVITYSFLGAICGILGHLVAMAGFQRILSIAVGIIILLAILLPSKVANYISPRPLIELTSKLKKLWAGLLNSHSVWSLFVIGLLNGFLPCGLLYVALAAASTTGSMLRGVIYMALFGLGTFPLMLAFSLFGGMLPSAIRKLAPRLLPAGAILIALLLILRGLSLGIPFISPRLHTQVEQKQDRPLLDTDCCK